MKVKGVKSELVTVEVKPNEVVRGLAEVIGVQTLFEDISDEYVELEEKEGKYYIVTQRNISYHGTPHYQEYSRKELTREEYTAACGLQELMKIIKKY